MGIALMTSAQVRSMIARQTRLVLPQRAVSLHAAVATQVVQQRVPPVQDLRQRKCSHASLAVAVAKNLHLSGSNKEIAMEQLALPSVIALMTSAQVRSMLARQTRLVLPQRAASLHAAVATQVVQQRVPPVQDLRQRKCSHASLAVVVAIQLLFELVHFVVEPSLRDGSVSGQVAKHVARPF